MFKCVLFCFIGMGREETIFVVVKGEASEDGEIEDSILAQDPEFRDPGHIS